MAGIGYCVTGRASVLYCRVEWGTVLQDGRPYFTEGRFGILCYRTGDRTLLKGGLGYCVTGRASVLYCRAERGTVLQVTGLVSVLYCRVERGTVLQVGCPYFTEGRFGVLCYRTGVRTLLKGGLGY